MLDAIKQLLESNVINGDTHDAIMEAWEARLNEAREELRAELREEFAQRYDHDKKVMVEALNKMMTEGLKSEIAEFVQEKKAIAEDRVKMQKKMTENAAKFNNFLVAQLAEEIKELRAGRKAQMEGLEKVQAFVAEQLAKEIREFARDKQDVVEAKVRLVAEARDQLKALKARFIKESAEKVQNHVKQKLSEELTALRKDIKVARENNFGRRIYETFGSEFVSTFLNENAEIRKLKAQVATQAHQIAESKVQLGKAKALTESKEKQIRMITESNRRQEVLTDLLAPLNAEKREIMSNLLESVQTNRLAGAFEKYLPAVLANKAVGEKSSAKKVINESRKEVTGDKTVSRKKEDDGDIIDFKKLAGLVK